ncbi:transporter substrate-binding domain-containing protein [Sulfurimonas sp.]|uniref:transporter substrate-binding domain-containing protein n=1 Tax=Sulfurimonas sp. TaxID=2022749 RepID=UPI003C785954
MKLISLFFLILFFAEASATIKTLNLTINEKKFIKNHPNIILGTDKRWAPYVVVDEEGKISGYDMNVLTLINEISGANFSLVAGDWNKMKAKAKRQEIDGLSTGSAHEEREIYLNFSNIYIEMQKMLIVSSVNPNNIHTVDDLEDKIIAIHSSNLVDEKISRKFTNSIILRFEKLEDVISSVVTAKADVMFGNGTTLYGANKIGLPYLKREGSLDESLKLRFSVRKDWPEAISIINKSLKLIGEHKLLEIKNRWFFNNNNVFNKNLSEVEYDYLKNNTNLNICVDPNWMPIEAIVNNKYVGIGADIVKYFNKELKINIRVVKTKTWSESIKMMQKRKCDVLTLSSSINNKLKNLNFTSSYFQVPLVIVTRKNTQSIIDISFIKNKKIAIIKDYAINDIIKSKYDNLEIVEVDSMEEGLNMLRNNEIFAFGENALTMQYYFKDKVDEELKINTYFDEKLQLSFATNKEDKTLHIILNKSIKKITDEEKQSIINKWFLFEDEKEFDNSLFYKLMVVFCIIFVILVLRSNAINKSNIQLQKRVEEELQKSRDKDKILFHQNKLASMGEMLENIAHQWRQPLSQINSSVLLIDTVLNEKNNMNPEIEERLLEIESLTKYLSNTIDDFKDFFDEDKDKKTFSLKSMIEKSVYIVKGGFTKHEIEIEVDIHNSFMCYSYENELQQVLVVILNNAKDSLVNRNTYQALISVYVKIEGDFYIIEIYDNAGGIAKDIRDKIFEPYFTTKHKSQGRGLGLYMAKKIIHESLGGKLSFSNREFGACFEIKIKAGTE